MDLSFRQARLKRICTELEQLIIVKTAPVSAMEWRPGTLKDGGEFAPYDGGLWGGKNTDAVFRFFAVIPPEMNGFPVILRVSTDGHGGWAKNDPQPLAYVNGEIRQGLDINHPSVVLSEKAEAGTRYEIVLDCWSAMPEEKCYMSAKLCSPDRETEGLYYDLKVAEEAEDVLDDSHPQKSEMLSVLADALDILDLRCPHSAAYNDSVRKCRAFLQERFYGVYQNREMLMHAIGHTHIDVAWLWPLSATRKKTVRSFATVIELMKRYPEYRFSSSTPQIYEFVREDAPELYDAVKERIAEGRFEPEGAMWLEADCNLISGESFVRQLVHGKRYFISQFGRENRLLWMPDVFGYSAALPQLLKKSGVDYFYTTKIGWNEYNRMPNDVFRWKGIDGSEVLTYFHQQNQDLHPEKVARLWNMFKNRDLSREVMTAYGYGDGGGGPTEEMLEYGRRLQHGLPGIPAVHQGNMLEFIEDTERKVKDNPRLPVWSGELYLEYHRGTYTSMAKNKRNNRKAELALHDLEALACMVRDAAGEPYPADELYAMWQTVLLNQFHDIIPGSSIAEVYADSDADYAALFEKADSMRARMMDILRRKAGGAVVVNTLGYPRSGYVTVNGEKRFVADVPAMGWKALADAPNAAEAPRWQDGVMENAYFALRLDENGEIASLWDKRAGREAFSGTANRLTVYEDKPHRYDAWDINYYYREKPYTVGKADEVKVTEQSGETLAVEVVRRYESSVICQTYRMYARTDRVDIETEIDWKESQQLLKAFFPLDVNADKASFDIQFGNVERPTHQNTTWDAAKFEVCAHKWADMSDAGYGVSLLNDCKYGFSCQYGGLELTILKSALSPNPGADKEIHRFTYSVYPHEGGWRQADTVRQAYDLNIPLLYTGGADTGAKEMSFAEVRGNGVMLETVKQAYDSDETVLRVYEYNNARVSVDMFLGECIEQAVECDLLERETGEPMRISDGGRSFSFMIKPYEVKSFKIRRKG